MPELPEVETVRNRLKKELINKKIMKVNIIYKNIIAEPTIEEFIKGIENKTIKDIKRLGKWLIFEFDDVALLSHLRMEGKYSISKLDKKLEKHEHVIFELNDGNKLIYKDTRKFGRMHLKKLDEVYNTKPLTNVGLEPFDKNMTVKYLRDKFGNKGLPIKTLLLDQSILAGLGNIYVNEVLFASKINPLEQSKDLSDNDLQNIIDNSIRILNKAIKEGGTTIHSYESFNGETGSYQDNLYVHGKKVCRVCGSKIEKIKVNGRGTYYCTNCQQKKVDKDK